ncbi:hypothetical protein A2U01_0061768 [Trifolium medium]|uniref:Uncharacterized protein n=1 Tax=Trifolium medium TaxID=97028 RepID=A0A392RY37_9FABA|nr:hypothetical protein [Trifolium medium]
MPTRAAPTPEENQKKQGYAARRASPSCAPRCYPKVKPPSAPSTARRAVGRKPNRPS